jgi:hypothetical protein
VKRPFFNDSITSLEEHFQDRKGDPEFLEILAAELSFRSSARAKKLRTEVDKCLARLAIPKPTKATEKKEVTTSVRERNDTKHLSPHGTENNEIEPGSNSPFQQFLDAHSTDHTKDATVYKTSNAPATDPLKTNSQLKQQEPKKKENNPIDILSAWTALEVLSPQTFRKPEELTAGDKKLIAPIANTTGCPWEGLGERSKRDHRLYYQVVIGTIDFQKSIDKLLDLYADPRVERPNAKGEAILAVVIVDQKGYLLEPNAIGISSFGWGVAKAIKGSLDSLTDWPVYDQQLQATLEKVLRQHDETGKELPLSFHTINKAYNTLVETLHIPRELVKDNIFAIRTYQYFKNPEVPEPILLNSFFLNDLTNARSLFKEGKSTKNLRLFLGVDKPTSRKDLFNDLTKLEETIAPDLIPTSRWPGKGRHPLMLLQQAAVNVAFKELVRDGIVAVNGPPGTGKTTLLRDIVASIITQRAEVLCSYDDPASAFTNSNERLQAGSSWLHLYRIDSKLKGFEILITSSNNKAVENVSAEFPTLDAIAEDAHDLRYFKPLSDELLNKQSWGIVAAVLGNASNRYTFNQRFWWNDDVGIRVYLAHASGTPQSFEIKDNNGNVIGKRLPQIITACDAPSNNTEALQRWKSARRSFLSALKASKNRLNELTALREKILNLAKTEKEKEELEVCYEKANSERKQIGSHLRSLLETIDIRLDKLREQEQKLGLHKKIKPNFLHLLFNTGPAKDWKKVKREISTNIRSVQEQIAEFEYHRKKQREALSAKDQQIKEIHNQLTAAIARIQQLHAELDPLIQKYGSHVIDHKFYTLRHTSRQVLSPWCDRETQELRDTVFIESIKLHKAFIDAAAKPIRHNLGAMMMVLSGKKMPDEKKLSLVPDLWTTLFLMIPCLSTTFASIERMIGNLPPESLGWLLVDEAGQAVPQAVVGAMMRTKRAVIVGDPIQIEPVVTLPATLTANICHSFGIDPDIYNAPESSVQTLGDSATSYYAQFETSNGSRSVGVPLLVHRRCSEPMFSISNTIAYSNLMVSAKKENPSAIKECLGISRWFDVQGVECFDKWCKAEGELVLKLLAKLRTANVIPDLYIITPFVIVAQNLRTTIQNSGILEGWVENSKWIYERIGTVHTVQGREAEAVIFVLGAPLQEQAGARNWAGGRPNLLNVAITRAKEVLYVVGNKNLWKNAGLFKELARIPSN